MGSRGQPFAASVSPLKVSIERSCTRTPAPALLAMVALREPRDRAPADMHADTWLFTAYLTGASAVNYAVP